MLATMSLRNPASLGGIAVLVAALIFAMGGVALLFHSARMTRETVSKRIGLIRRDTAGPSRSAAHSTALARADARGEKEQEHYEIIRIMARLGLPAERATATFTVARIVAALMLALVAFVAGAMWLFSGAEFPLLSAIGIGIVGWFAPMMWLSRQVKKRTKAIVAALPDAMELLVICVQAGLSFEDGIGRVAKVLERVQPALAEELTLTSADMKILPNRDQALTNLAKRIDRPAIHSVVRTLSQTLRYGTPLAQALKVVSTELRNESLIRLEERANQLPSLMTVPMMIFILPTIFMIVGGPAALRVMDAMSHH